MTTLYQLLDDDTTVWHDDDDVNLGINHMIKEQFCGIE